jgi:hypothetical protein
VLKELEFELSFDDPRSPEETWLSLKGDRVQLEALREAVELYVQIFLDQSPSQLNATLLPLDSRSNRSATRLSPAGDAFSLLSPTANPLTFRGAESGEALMSESEAGRNVIPFEAKWHDRQSQSQREVSPSGDPRFESHQIYLQPQGLLHHTLFLGALATAESGPMVRLTTLQLFDLASALDEYATDVLALPSLNSPRWLKASPSWARVAAIALLTIGLTTSLAKILDGSYPSTQVANSPTSSQGASSADQQMAQQIPSATSPAGTLPVPSPLASGQKLPPPPPPGSALPVPSGFTTVPVPQTAPVTPIVPGPPSNSRSTGSTSNGNRDAKTPAQIALAEQQNSSSRGAAKSRLRPEVGAAAGSSLSVPAAESSREAAAAVDRNTTAFDTIPQVAEARQYFKDRWQPPEGLSQTLEYTLVLAPDGTIQRISPLGLASGDYIDRTGMPLLGESFVSAIAGGRSPKIRVVLSPDGKVQTFLQGFE